jgi:hypothetical protein
MLFNAQIASIGPLMMCSGLSVTDSQSGFRAFSGQSEGEAL